MFESLMDNYQRVEDLAKAGENSFGQLAEANQKRVESFEGQLNILKDKMLAFTDGLQPLIFGSVELGNKLLDLVNGFGAIPTVVGLASASFLSFSDSGHKLKSTLLEMVGAKNEWVNGLNQIISAQNQKIEGAKNEVAITKQQISSTIETIAKLRLEHSTRNDNTEAIAKQQQALVGLNQGLVKSQKELTIATLKATALQSVLSLGLGAAIGVAITLITKLGKEMIELNKSYSVEGIAESVSEMKTKFEEASTSLENYKKAKTDVSTMKSLVDSINNENLSASEQEEKIATINELLSQHASSYQSIESILNNENISYERRIELLEREAELQRQLTGQAAYDSFMKEGTFFGLGLGDNTFEKTIKQLDQLVDKTNDAKAHLDHAIEGLESGSVTEAGYNSVKNSFDLLISQVETDVASLATSLAQQMNFAMQSLDSGHMTQDEYDKIAQNYKTVIEEVNKALQDAGIEGFSMYDLLLPSESEAEESVKKVADSISNSVSDIVKNLNIDDFNTEKASTSLSELKNAIEEVEEGSDEAKDVLELLRNEFADMPDDVDTLADAIDYLNGKLEETSESADMKDLNESYLKALEGIEEAQDLIDSFADGLDASELRNIFDSDLMADYNGSLNDAANMLDHIKSKMQEMKDQSYEASVAMVLNNSDAWNSMTSDMANSLNIQEQGFQDFVNSLGGMRQVDIQNAQNSADAQLKAEMNLVGQGAMYYAGFVNSKANNRETDMNNVLDFLNTQGVAEAKTIEQLAQLWAEYYKAKKAEITDTIDKMAGDYGDLGNVDPALMKQLHDLQRLNSNMNNYFANINTNFGGIGAGLSQATASAGSAISNATKPGGSSSSGNKGSSSSSSEKEVEDLDLQIDRYYDLQDAIDDVNNVLDKNQTLQERATGVEKAKLMKEEIQLYKDLQKATQDLVKEQQKERDELKKTISSYGGTFDSNGDLKDRKKWLEGLQAQVNKLSGEAKEAKKEEIETLMSIIERYEELHNDTIPSTQLEYENLTNTIKDLQKEQLEYITDLQKDITSAIESELKKRTEAIKSELEKQKELYNSQYDEETWGRELATEQRKLDEIQQQIDNAMRDTSLAGQLYLQQLREEYAAQEEVINEMIRDKEHELGQNRFDEEIEKIEKEEEAMLDPENIADLVNKAIANGFITIGNETIQLNQLMSDWLDDTGDGLYAVGNLLKSEMIDNLKTVKSLMQDVGLVSLSGGVAVSSATYVPTANTRAIDNAISNNTNNNSNVSIGSLLTVQGNVTEDVMPQLQGMISQSEKRVVNMITDALKFK